MSRTWKARRASKSWQVHVFDAKRSDWVVVMANYRSIAAAMRKARRLRGGFHVRVTDQHGKEIAQWLNGQRLEASR